MTNTNRNISPEAVLRTFTWLSEHEEAGIRGVWRIDSGLEGPVVGITVHTHGNEPSGLAAVAYFREVWMLQDKLRRGSVVFVLNNIKATEEYFAATSEAKVQDARWSSSNMNRLPADIHSDESQDYEVQRAKELLPIWKTFDAGLDIHSMSVKSEPFVISIGTLRPDLIRGFPVDMVISNIDKIQHNKPATAYYGSHDIPVFGVETGQHYAPESIDCAIECTLALLKNVGVIDGEEAGEVRECDEFFIDGAVRFEDESYELVKVFLPFEEVAEGQILARGGGGEIKAPFDGLVIMPPATTRPSKYGPQEEVLFLSRPKRILKL